MSYVSDWSLSPTMWRTGVGGETSSATQTRISYDSLRPRPWLDDRDDGDSDRKAIGASEIPDEKVQKIDALLRRIEVERKKSTTPESTPPPRQGTTATSRRSQRERRHSSASPVNYDFASRAKELRMSFDGIQARSRTPIRSERERKENHFVQLARDMKSDRASSSPIKLRMLYEGMTAPHTFTPKRSESPSEGHDFSRRSRDKPHRSACNSPPHTASSVRSSSPNLSQTDFRLQVEKFHSSLVSAHDTITTLEQDVRGLKKRIDEKEQCISSIEQSNRSLEEFLTKSRDEVRKIEGEKNSLLIEKSALSRKHSDEIAKLKTEYDGYKKHASETDKLSAKCDETVKEIQKEKEKLESRAHEKDKVITSLRDEIQRLNEELADGSFVRSQASQAVATSKKIQIELDKSRNDHTSATKVIVDLEVRMKELSGKFDRELKEKENLIATLQSELVGGKSMKQISVTKLTRFESQLDEANLQQEKLLDKVKELEQHLLCSEKASTEKDKEIKFLESLNLKLESGEKDLTRQLKKERRELRQQRERMEKYVADSASEQVAVAALEQAIESLETAHNESSDEITRLQKENQSLAAALTEAEAYLKKYQRDIKDSSGLKSMVGGMQDMNSDLVKQIQNRDEHVKVLNERIRKFNEHIRSLEVQVESCNASTKQRILELENEVCSKQDAISGLQQELTSTRNSQAQEERANNNLVEMATLLDENVTELEQLRTNKGKMLRTISNLEKEVELLKKEAKSSHALGAKLDKECQVEKSQREDKRAWARVSELEEHLKTLQNELSKSEQQADRGSQAEALKSELKSIKEKLAERDEQLADSRKGIAEAQKMIFRLMGTVQELRKKARERESPQFVAIEG